MILSRRPAFLLEATYKASAEAEETELREYVGITGGGVPRLSYRGVKRPDGDASFLGNASAISGSEAPLPPFFANKYVSEIDGTFGLLSWSIHVHGRVSGLLELGYWLSTNPDLLGEPDDVLQFSIGPSSWGTGALPIITYDPAADPPPYYVAWRARFACTHLVPLLD